MNLIYKFFLICFLIILTDNNSAQTVRSIGEIFYDDISILLDDGISFFGAPAKFSTREWLYTAGLFSGTYLTMHFDKDIKKMLGRNTIKTINGDFWDVPTYYGFIQYSNSAAIAGYTIGLLTGYDELRNVSRVLFESLSYSGLLVMSARILAGRERPYSGKGPWKFTGITLDNEVQSFPSGHSTVAFAISTAIAEYYDNNWLRVGFYGMALLTAYSRVLNNQHWFSDVIIGSAIGIAGGLHVVYKDRLRNNEYPNKRLSFSIIPGGISARYTLN